MIADLVRRTISTEQKDQAQSEQELKSLLKVRNLELFCRNAVKMVTANFEKVLTKGVAMEMQINAIEQKSNRRSSNSDSWASHHRSFNLNLNKTGEHVSPKTGETLLFVCSSRASGSSQDDGL